MSARGALVCCLMPILGRAALPEPALAAPLFPLHRWTAPEVNISAALQMLRLSSTPPIYRIQSLLSAEESDLLVGVARELGIQRTASGVFTPGEERMPDFARPRGGAAAAGYGEDVFSLISSLWRNSSTTWVPHDVLPVLAGRISAALRVPASRVAGGEPIQVVHYGAGGYYLGHLDTMLPRSARLKLEEAGRLGQPFDPSVFPLAGRYATVLVFLNTPDEGGHVCFPFAGRSALRPRDFGIPSGSSLEDKGRQAGLCGACAGVAVEPRQGDAVLFYNHRPDKLGLLGGVEAASWHAACPVARGEKWAANVWVSVPLPQATRYPVDGVDYSDFFERWLGAQSRPGRRRA